ncbi:MAG: hypothetical protein BGO26_17805 [Actinobacteria bacterium 69-20]|nr:adenosylcobinamide amidohydrolase [Actinomycetota bacterium]OJV24944.1 MAG: hypothetical protein BGO26_17805 [Actinobacteria bacterium 69-20]
MTGAAADVEFSSHADDGAGQPAPMLLWRFAGPQRAVSSAMLGGGLKDISWIVNAHVRSDYRRMDPDRHLREIALGAGLDPAAGIGLLTAAKVERNATAEDGGVRCDATVGVSYPTWAAATDDDPLPDNPWRPGTINIVCQLPVPLSDAALVGAVITATEAKTQALIEGGVPGTGTASDAIVICCPRPDEPRRAGGSGLTGAVAELTGAAAELTSIVPFAGPRSPWGARLARAVHAAVALGLSRYG